MMCRVGSKCWGKGRSSIYIITLIDFSTISTQSRTTTYRNKRRIQAENSTDRNHEASRRYHLPDLVHLGVIHLPAPIPLYSPSFLLSIAPNDLPSASNEPLANSVRSAFAGHNCKCQDPSGTGPQWDWATEKVCKQMSTGTCWATYHGDQHHQVKLRTLCPYFGNAAD